MDVYKKMDHFVEFTAYYSTKSWTFHDTNIRSMLSKMSKLDQSLFKFDMTDLNWYNYYENYVRGIRLYIVKDPLDTIPDGLKRIRKLVAFVIT